MCGNWTSRFFVEDAGPQLLQHVDGMQKPYLKWRRQYDFEKVKNEGFKNIGFRKLIWLEDAEVWAHVAFGEHAQTGEAQYMVLRATDFSGEVKSLLQ